VIAPRGRRRGVRARALNGVMALILGRLGVPVPRVWMLRVHGRRTGRLRSVPVLVLRRGRDRFLVAPHGETDWTRNLRAAGWGELWRRRATHRVSADELLGEDRTLVVEAYARRYRWLTGRFFDLPRRFSRDDVRRIAGGHPAFRLRPADGAPGPSAPGT